MRHFHAKPPQTTFKNVAENFHAKLRAHLNQELYLRFLSLWSPGRWFVCENKILDIFEAETLKRKVRVQSQFDFWRDKELFYLKQVVLETEGSTRKEGGWERGLFTNIFMMKQIEIKGPDNPTYVSLQIAHSWSKQRAWGVCLCYVSLCGVSLCACLCRVRVRACRCMFEERSTATCRKTFFFCIAAHNDSTYDGSLSSCDCGPEWKVAPHLKHISPGTKSSAKLDRPCITLKLEMYKEGEYQRFGSMDLTLTQSCDMRQRSHLPASSSSSPSLGEWLCGKTQRYGRPQRISQQLISTFCASFSPPLSKAPSYLQLHPPKQSAAIRNPVPTRPRTPAIAFRNNTAPPSAIQLHSLSEINCCETQRYGLPGDQRRQQPTTARNTTATLKVGEWLCGKITRGVNSRPQPTTLHNRRNL